MYGFIDIQNELKKILKPERFEHTLGVMYTAAALAMRYGSDLNQAMAAGLLHDCGKFGSSKEQIALCREYEISLTAAELKTPALIHAKLGAYLAKNKYKITDNAIIDSVLYHTTGRPGMTLLDKIIYIADYIEPNREMIPSIESVRKSAFVDIDKAVAISARATISYLNKENRPIDSSTVKTYEFYKKFNQEVYVGKRKKNGEACSKSPR